MVRSPYAKLFQGALSSPCRSRFMANAAPLRISERTAEPLGVDCGESATTSSAVRARVVSLSSPRSRFRFTISLSREPSWDAASGGLSRRVAGGHAQDRPRLIAGLFEVAHRCPAAPQQEQISSVCAICWSGNNGSGKMARRPLLRRHHARQNTFPQQQFCL